MENLVLEKVIAIDGPSGSGKSTTAKKIAERLDILYVDTGAMFRALGLFFFQEEVDFSDESKLRDLLPKIKFEYGKSPSELIIVNEVNLTRKIREHFVSDLASKISKIAPIRQYLLNFQRQLVKLSFGIMEGRDIGTVVFPNAFLKIFLTASPEKRAQRRFKELQLAGTLTKTIAEIQADITERDERDANRQLAPLKASNDAQMLDTSDKDIEQVVTLITQWAQTHAKKYGLKICK